MISRLTSICQRQKNNLNTLEHAVERASKLRSDLFRTIRHEKLTIERYKMELERLEGITTAFIDTQVWQPGVFQRLKTVELRRILRTEIEEVERKIESTVLEVEEKEVLENKLREKLRQTVEEMTQAKVILDTLSNTQTQGALGLGTKTLKGKETNGDEIIDSNLQEKLKKNDGDVRLREDIENSATIEDDLLLDSRSFLLSEDVTDKILWKTILNITLESEPQLTSRSVNSEDSIADMHEMLQDETMLNESMVDINENGRSIIFESY